MDTQFVSAREKSSQAILIVDKKNLYGEEIGKSLTSYATTVLVSEKKPTDPNIIHVPFFKRVPEIPHGEYSHIFLISDEEAENELLVPLAQKAEENKGKFIYVTSHWLYAKRLEENIAALCSKWTIILLGDIFSARFPTKIQDLFFQIKKKNTISLSNLGLQTLRPIAYEDAAGGIIHGGFGSENAGVCFAFSKHPYTELSLVHGLQKVDPLIKIDFKMGEPERSFALLPEGTFIVDATYPVIKKIQEEYEKYSPKKDRKQDNNSSFFQPKSSPKKRNSSLQRTIVSFFIAFCVALFLPVCFVLATVGGGVKFLELAKEEATQGHLSQAQLYAQAGANLFQWGASSVDILYFEAKLVGQQGSIEKLQKQIQSGEQLGEIMTLFLKGASSLQEIVTGRALVPIHSLTEGTNAIKNGLVLLQTFDDSSLPKLLRQEIDELHPLVNLVGETIDVWPHIFGFDQARSYAILFQNNTELRPGGGFIGSYAIVKINKGRLSDFSIHDVYDADGQLKGHVEPPFAIRRYMPLVHWYLRDSNFSADNLKNAQTAAFFLQQETGVTVDGIITLDLSFVQQVIKSLGSIYVPEYNETVTANNFYLVTQSHVEKNSFAGSTQKKDFLTALFSALQAKLFTKKISYVDLLKQSIASIAQKDLLFAFSDKSIQQVFTVNNLSSALWDVRPAGSGVNDFTAISEANLGVNKVNGFINRKIFQNMTVGKNGSASGALKVVYENISDGSWPGGTYKNYVRFLLPQGTVLTNILLNGVAQSRYPAVIDPKIYEAAKFQAPKGIEVEQTIEGGKIGYAFLVTVPIHATLSVEIDYTIAQKIDTTQTEFSFDELLFKQPGTVSDPHVFSLSFPPEWKLTNKPEGSVVGVGNIQMSENFDTDKEYVFTFTKQ